MMETCAFGRQMSECFGVVLLDPEQLPKTVVRTLITVILERMDNMVVGKCFRAGSNLGKWADSEFVGVFSPREIEESQVLESFFRPRRARLGGAVINN